MMPWWLRPHGTGRHVVMRGVAALSGLALCAGVAPLTVTARFHDATKNAADGDAPDTAPQYELPPRLQEARECPSLLPPPLQQRLGATPSLLVYLRPSLALEGMRDSAVAAAVLNALRGARPPRAWSALHVLTAPLDALLDHGVCERAPSAAAAAWPTLAQATPAELLKRFRVDVLDPRMDRAPAPLVGALLLDVQASSSGAWDASALPAALHCLQTEDCAAARANLAVAPGMRGDVVLSAALMRAAFIFHRAAVESGAVTGAEALAVPVPASCYAIAAAAAGSAAAHPAPPAPPPPPPAQSTRALAAAALARARPR